MPGLPALCRPNGYGPSYLPVATIEALSVIRHSAEASSVSAATAAPAKSHDGHDPDRGDWRSQRGFHVHPNGQHQFCIDG